MEAPDKPTHNFELWYFLEITYFQDIFLWYKKNCLEKIISVILLSVLWTIYSVLFVFFIQKASAKSLNEIFRCTNCNTATLRSNITKLKERTSVFTFSGFILLGGMTLHIGSLRGRFVCLGKELPLIGPLEFFERRFQTEILSVARVIFT